jgi:hypothetical protein
VDGFIATPESNMNLWSALSGRLHERTLTVPRHERLLAELRGLRQESFSFGSKWRIVDASKKFHRDVAVSLAGACHAAGGLAHVGPLDKHIMQINLDAPSLTTVLGRAAYGRCGGGSLNDAYGTDADISNAFGGSGSGFKPFG